MDAIANPADTVTFQRALAEELRKAEADSSADAVQHRHLLRLMGDALAWRLLDRHTIRELARGRLRSAPLAGQGADFDFVLEVAEKTAAEGAIPIVADLTHLIAVGDIVAVTPIAVSIIECKNTTPPAGMALSSRHWRQQQRGVQATDYLTYGQVTTKDGSIRIAIDINEPQRDDEALRTCIEQASKSPVGSAFTQLGERDFLVALWERDLNPSIPLGDFISQFGTDQWRFPKFAESGTSIDNPSPFFANPYALPLPAQMRLAMADRELIVLRFVDLGMLEHQHEENGQEASITVYKKGGNHHLRMSIDGKPLEVSGRFIDQVLRDFQSLADTRSALLEMLDAMREIDSTEASPAMPSVYGFAYRNQAESDDPIIAIPITQLANLDISVPLDEFAALDAVENFHDQVIEIPCTFVEEGDKISLQILNRTRDDEKSQAKFDEAGQDST